MKEKAEEFKKSGAKIYLEATEENSSNEGMKAKSAAER